VGHQSFLIHESEGKVFDPVHQIDWLVALSHQVEILNALADADAKLMAVHDARELAAVPLPLGCDCQKVLVLREHGATKLSGSLEEHVVFLFGPTVILAVITSTPRSSNCSVMLTWTWTSM
jgi:hypothetical protein